MSTLRTHYIDLPEKITRAVEGQFGRARAFSVAKQVRAALGEMAWNGIEEVRKQAADRIDALEAKMVELKAENVRLIDQACERHDDVEEECARAEQAEAEVENLQFIIGKRDEQLTAEIELSSKFCREKLQAEASRDRLAEALREADVLLGELIDKPSSRAFYGVEGVVHGKLQTIRLTLKRGVRLLPSKRR